VLRVRSAVMALLVPVALLAAHVACPAADEPAPVAPGKFIPTYAVAYGGSEGWLPAEQAAHFDLLDVGSSPSFATILQSEYGNTWQTLKHHNPHIVITIYQNGPSLFDTDEFRQPGADWTWIKANHGIGSADPWIAIGAQHGGYLQGTPYPNEMLMNIRNANWRQWWVEQTWARSWGGDNPPGLGANAIFSDNTMLTMPWGGGWHTEGKPAEPDVPSCYYRDGGYDIGLFKPCERDLLALAIPWLKERGVTMVLNFAGMSDRPERWLELDALNPAPFAAMEEGAFASPWGRTPGSFSFSSEEEWRNLVDTMAKLRNVRALMNIHGPVSSAAPGIERMAGSDASGNRAWDVLWYAMTSFLQGLDTERHNAYMNFTIWNYGKYFWFDEWDPKYLDLGHARGPYQMVPVGDAHVYLREFDDGWAAANPTAANAAKVAVPGGAQARVLNHYTFKHPDDQPLVSTFDLPAHRGVILLKPGRQIGNQDNQ